MARDKGWGLNGCDMGVKQDRLSVEMLPFSLLVEVLPFSAYIPRGSFRASDLSFISPHLSQTYLALEALCTSSGAISASEAINESRAVLEGLAYPANRCGDWTQTYCVEENVCEKVWRSSAGLCLRCSYLSGSTAQTSMRPSGRPGQVPSLRLTSPARGGSGG